MIIQNFDILNFLANGVHISPPIPIAQGGTRKSALSHTVRISFAPLPVNIDGASCLQERLAPMRQPSILSCENVSQGKR